MAYVIDGSPANFEVHFLDSDNPRDGFRIMSMNPPIFYEFRTPIGFLSTHTIVTDVNLNGATVITFNWFGANALGTMTWPGPPPHEAHMGDLVQAVPLRTE
jgi:hypothetical protein